MLSSRRGFYAPIFYVLEALRCGARFLPPDVNLSEPRFLVRGDTIRLPLDQVKGLTPATLERIHAARPFRDAGDFYRRARPAHAEWLALLKVGALDSLGEPRGRLFWRLCRLEAARAGGERAVAGGRRTMAMRAVARQSQSRWEHELLGFPVSCHPLDYFAPKVDWSRYVPAAEVNRYMDKQVEVCGLIVADRIHSHRPRLDEVPDAGRPHRLRRSVAICRRLPALRPPDDATRWWRSRRSRNRSTTARAWR